MIWIILFIPLCAFLSLHIMADMTAASLAVLLLVVGIFLLVEFGQVRKDSSRSKTPIWIMLILLASIGVSFLI